MKQYKAVSGTGCQPDSNVFVFGPNLQLSGEGEPIPLDEQEYIWIPQILDKLHRTVNPIPPLISIPSPLKHILEGLHRIAGDNLPSGVYVLSRFI